MAQYAVFGDNEVGPMDMAHEAARKADERLFVQFYMSPTLQQKETEDAGRPIYKDVEFVRIIVPGQKDLIIEQPVDQFVKARFARRYADWKSGAAEEAVVGTPLGDLSFINASMREELAYFKVRTAEQLVSMPDNLAQRFAGMQQLKARVQQFLDAAAGEAPLNKMRGENEALKAQVEAQDKALQALQAQVEELARRRPQGK